MPLTLIKGQFRIVGSSPDGDSVRFYPDSKDAFRDAGLRVRTNAHGGAQLRLEGIDALETHYRPQVSDAPMWRQPKTLGDAASAALLEHLGFTDVQRGEDGRVSSAVPEQTSGHIMTRFADKYGRAVSFAFPGRARGGDGRQVHLDVDTMTRSANYQLLESGLAYPTFYSLLYPDLRQAMAQAATNARTAGSGVWEHDATLPGFTLSSTAQLRDELVILPKLFRRLVDYLALDEPDGVSLTGFSHYLDTRDDRLFTVPDGHATELHTLVKISRQSIILTVEPERIIFKEG